MSQSQQHNIVVPTAPCHYNAPRPLDVSPGSGRLPSAFRRSEESCAQSLSPEPLSPEMIVNTYTRKLTMSPTTYGHQGGHILPTPTTPSLLRDVVCDKCKQSVRGGDFRTHNKLCLGKLCNRCQATVVGSYDEHKAICVARKCDRCGIVPTGSFTAHNKSCKETTVCVPCATLTAPTPVMAGYTGCKTCGAVYLLGEEQEHEVACGRVCCYCKKTYSNAWEDHQMECDS